MVEIYSTVYSIKHFSACGKILFKLFYLFCEKVLTMGLQSAIIKADKELGQGPTGAKVKEERRWHGIA